MRSERARNAHAKRIVLLKISVVSRPVLAFVGTGRARGTARGRRRGGGSAAGGHALAAQGRRGRGGERSLARTAARFAEAGAGAERNVGTGLGQITPKAALACWSRVSPTPETTYRGASVPVPRLPALGCLKPSSGSTSKLSNPGAGAAPVAAEGRSREANGAGTARCLGRARGGAALKRRRFDEAGRGGGGASQQCGGVTEVCAHGTRAARPGQAAAGRA